MQIYGSMKLRHTIQQIIFENIVQLNVVKTKSEPKELVRKSVEEALNRLLEFQTDKLAQNSPTCA